MEGEGPSVAGREAGRGRGGILPGRRRRLPTMPQSQTDTQDHSRLPIGMFDSGMGGCTVLHECLVRLPGEHFAYVGDTARFPYGEKGLDELHAGRARSPPSSRPCPASSSSSLYLLLTSAALPVLQEQFATPIIGVVTARVAVETSRYRKIGVLYGGDRGQWRLPPRHPQPRFGHRGHRTSLSRPRGLHRGGGRRQPGCSRPTPSRASRSRSRRGARTSSSWAAPTTRSSRPRQRFLGRDVTLINPAAEIAREVEAMLERQGLERPGDARAVPLLHHRRR